MVLESNFALDRVLSLTQKPSPAITLNTTGTLKVTFQVVDKDSGNGVQPHQTFLRFYDAKSGEEGIQPVRVTAGGKAKFELNVSKPPLSLPPTSLNDPLSVTLILGSTIYSPLKVDIFDLVLPPSLPVPAHPDEASFHVLPEIQHTFRPEQKLPPRPVSALFSLMVIAPWVVLVGLWSQVSPRPTHLFSPSILPFIQLLTLGAFEVLLFWYWVDLKLGQVLTYGAILGVVMIFTGRNALASIGARRLQGKK
ncbi:oligosaccharyl transferase delta subunit [Cyathus striatus]|nr:oligosaccharyl transferase delta subunit [Cyathus striatus]